jgi:hypothetical protein
MRDYIKTAFTRMNLHQIRAFILYGTEQKIFDDMSYKEKLEKSTEPLNNRINSLYSTSSELTSATNDIAKALSAYEEVYMEIGMKV